MTSTTRSAQARVPAHPALSDLLALTKPRITLFALITTAGGAALAPVALAPATWAFLLAGTGLIVAAANALNMYLERDIDCRMARTKNRPLPAGRMEPQAALTFGVSLAVVAVPVLTFGVNPLTAFLGVLAFVAYVHLYTPLKQRTTAATLIGSVPGAMPVLMGWTAATGGIHAGGVVLFGILFLWQVPHFHAIALYRRKDYDRAGLVVLPSVRGEETTRYAIVLYLAAQVQLTFLLWPLGVAGRFYAASAAVLGALYFAYAAWGVRAGGPRWARTLFLLSLLYLPALMAAMAVDRLLP